MRKAMTADPLIADQVTMPKPSESVEESEPLGAASGAGSRKRVDRRPGARRGSDEWRRRVGAGIRRHYERRREAERLGAGELAALERSGTVSLALRPFVAQAQSEALDLVEALGGESCVSEQRMLLIRDTVRLGVMLAALVARALQREVLDLDEAGKIASLVNARRANIVAAGLDRVTRELDLTEYLKQTAHDRAHGENDGEPNTGIKSAEKAQEERRQ
jgi:hypothetical protein